MNINFQKLTVLADENGLNDIAEQFTEVKESIETSRIKTFAILGDSNCGKSALLNCLSGKKVAPVSVIAGNHDPMLRAVDDERNQLWTELASGAYVGTHIKEAENQLWFMDAALYILSAIAPFSSHDVAAINACASHGVPCLIALNKLDLLPDEERTEVIESVKTQLRSCYGSAELLLLDLKQPEQTKAAVQKTFDDCEDSRDVRVYALTVQFAEALKKDLTEQFSACKVKVDAALHEEKSAQHKREVDKITWDQIELELNERKLKLVRATQTMAYDFYNRAGVNLASRAQTVPSVQKWWNTELESEMKRENVAILSSISRMVEGQLWNDNAWLIEEVHRQFGLTLDLEPTNFSARMIGTQPSPGVIEKPSNGKTVAALSGFAVSTAALIGSILFPPVQMIPAIIACSLTGSATLGTGFWAFYSARETKQEQAEIIRREIFKYVSDCRDMNLKSALREIEYFYESTLLAMKDKQIISEAENTKSLQPDVTAQIRRLNQANEQIEQILSQLLCTGEKD